MIVQEEKSEFDKYFKEAGWCEEYKSIAESAWNAAIHEIIGDNDEPYIYHEEIRKLYT